MSIEEFKGPASIARQAEEADRMMQELAEASSGQADKAEELVTNNIVDDPPKDVEPVSQDVTVNEPEDTQAGEVEELKALLKKADQRHSTLMGKYNAEVPRFASEVKELRAQIAELTEQLARKQEPEPQTQLKAPAVTQEDVDTFGDDMIDLIKRVASQVVQTADIAPRAEIEALRVQNQELREQLTGVSETQHVTSQQQVLSQLTQMVPDWQEVNASQGWLEWLAVVDPISGTNRQAHLDDANQKLDAGRLAALFNAYKAEAGMVSQTPTRTVRPEVQRQVTPGKSKGASTNTTSSLDNKVWTSQEIGEFYDNVRAGRVDGDAAIKTEAAIDLAMIQGRVR